MWFEGGDTYQNRPMNEKESLVKNIGIRPDSFHTFPSVGVNGALGKLRIQKGNATKFRYNGGADIYWDSDCKICVVKVVIVSAMRQGSCPASQREGCTAVAET